MSSKKKSFKKRSKKAISNRPFQSAEAKIDEAPSLATAVSGNGDIVVEDYKTSYIKSDIKRIIILVCGFVALQLVLAFLLSKPQVANVVYGFIKF